MLDTSYWPWATEFASAVVCVKEFKPHAKFVSFGDRVVFELSPCGKKGYAPKSADGMLLNANP